MQGGDLQDVLLAMLVTSVFIVVFVLSSIVHENAYALLAVIVLSALVFVRVVYYAVRPSAPVLGARQCASRVPSRCKLGSQKGSHAGHALGCTSQGQEAAGTRRSCRSAGAV